MYTIRFKMACILIMLILINIFILTYVVLMYTKNFCQKTDGDFNFLLKPENENIEPHRDTKLDINTYINQKVNVPVKPSKPLSYFRSKYTILNGYKIPSTDCASAFLGNYQNFDFKATHHELNAALGHLKEEAGKNEKRYCEGFVRMRGYILEPLCEEEENFSLAYNLLIYKDVEIFERLLRAIYRPQNVYCVHVDQSSSQLIKDQVKLIVNCFGNVIFPSRQVDVIHSTFTILEAEILCMEALLKHNKNWKYLINLTGQEFPLKTNLEIVRILKIFNGANNIGGSVKRSYMTRYNGKELPKFNVTLTKGSVHILASRSFIEYVIHNQTAQAFLNWTRDTYIPDETFFQSLNHSPQLGVPGSYLGNPEIGTGNYLFVARYKNWAGYFHDSYPCGGKYVRGICIFGVKDLPLLATRYELFANKFFSDFEPVAYDCLEELVFNRTAEDLEGVNRLNLTFFRELSFVKNHL